MKLLPLDTSSFRQIRESGNLYVDKTKWIYRLITKERCYFLSRPCRFGKSLTINTLKELFRGNKELFKGLWIYNKWKKGGKRGKSKVIVWLNKRRNGSNPRAGLGFYP